MIYCPTIPSNKKANEKEKKMKKIILLLTALMLSAALITGCGSKDSENKEAAEQTQDLTGKSLMIYCGAGMKEPFQKIANAFQEETGCEMKVTFANAAQIQTQINTSNEGDMFIAGSAEEVKPVEELVTTQTDLVKHIPVVAVQSGNPKGIKALEDLAKDGVSVLIGDPEATPIGKIANKIFMDTGIKDSVTLAAATTTAPQMTTALAAGEADAAIVWKENVKGDGVEIVNMKEMEKYIKTIPAASLSTAKDAEALKAFEEYLNSKAAQKIWTKAGYELV